MSIRSAAHGMIVWLSPLVGAAMLGVVLIGAVRGCTGGEGHLSAESHGVRGIVTAALIVRTLAIALGIGALATALSLPAAWCMRSLDSRWMALLLTPLLLPSYLVYAAWGTLRGPGTLGGDWIGKHAGPDLIRSIDTVQAIGGLALWAWPLAALIIGTSARRIDAETLDALRLSGAGWWRRLATVLSLLRGSLLAAIGVIGVMMIGSAIPLHVARVPTYAIEIWRVLAETAGSAAAWRAGLPLAAPAVIAAWIVGGRLLSRPSSVAEAGASEVRGSRGVMIAAIGVWVLSAGVPLALLAISLKHVSSIAAFFTTGGPSLLTSGQTALWVGLFGLLIGVSTAMALGGREGDASRRAARMALRAWLAAAFVPGILVGSAVLAASRVQGLGWLGQGETGVVVSHVVRFGGVAALAGWWCARSEPASLADVRQLSPNALAAWVAGPGRMSAALFIGAALTTALLSLHEIEATVVTSPPRPITEGGTLAELMLRLLHFNRDEELTAASLVLLAGGLVAGWGCALMGRGALFATALRRWAPVIALALMSGAMLGGCDRRPTAAAPLRVTAVFGEAGRAAGQFVVPRAIDTDGETLWIVDKSGSVQHLGADGHYIGRFALDRHDKGFPCGITHGPDGLLYVADTHENRVSVWKPTPDGSAIMIDEWGTYGTEPGQFIYPTDVAIVPAADGKTAERIYVAEYGGNDRISVFDAKHAFLFSFGHEGSSDSPDAIEFRRPQSIAYHHAKRELIVNDAVNHRIGRFDLDGKLIRWIGKTGGGPGNALGEFAYPYGLVLLEDGQALVSEFGNNRVQLVDLETGHGIGLYGESGRGDGQLVTPWGVAIIGGTAFVLDTGNSRVLAFSAPGRMLVSDAGEAHR